uniref:DNA2/NAM7 helicase helicase domain-containing protein n=1 Tax=Mola mola TaxID=94237 RepID=A0A3Q4B4S9_MOLML
CGWRCCWSLLLWKMLRSLEELHRSLHQQQQCCTTWGHEVDINLQLRAGDTLHVQMTSEIKRGYHMPVVQLMRIKYNFEICLEHVYNPITCFSRSADDPPRIHYSDTNEYVRIWKPMCEMESASTAVDESDSLIIENLVVNFSQEQEEALTGNFFLPLEWINEWAIECNLSKCLLCIRKRGLKLTETPKHSALVDPKEFTWVAHGVTRKVNEKKDPPNAGSTVEFYVNHLPMESIPDCVFQRNVFTVEIIPKLLPNIRTENAVLSITSASHLVQAIALGQRIPKEVKPDWNIVKKKPPTGLPMLNLSQHKAVDKALNNNLTLIWGPPGTGKTIVAVYIVYNFFVLNTKNPRKYVHPKDENKKEVIFYCGPSNKSVDVFAVYLSKFGESLRPLRVYSQHVETLDYPYPDCTRQFSQRTFRQERANAELRSITLHHRMREEQNPYSKQIKEFDKRIQVALDKKEELKRIQLALVEKNALQRSQKGSDAGHPVQNGKDLYGNICIESKQCCNTSLPLVF